MHNNLLNRHNALLYSAKFWCGKTLVANLAKRMSFTNILPSQIPDSSK